MNNYYDSHCHVFTRREILDFKQIAQILLALPRVLSASEKKFTKEQILDEIQEKSHLLERIKNFIKTANSDSEQNIYELMQEVYKSEFNLMPLMFDLEYCFVANRQHLQGVKKDNGFQKNLKSTLENFHVKNEKFIQKTLKPSVRKRAEKLSEENQKRLQRLNEIYKDTRTSLLQLKEKQLDIRALKPVAKASFRMQINDITILKKNNPESVYPFFAIDPRRKGVIEYFMKTALKKNVFSGVKLYTPNGYSPTDDDLMRKAGLYEFCCKHNFPLTVHNSYAGFASPLDEIEIFGDIYDVKTNSIKAVHGKQKFTRFLSENWIADKADKLNHPKLWEKVVKNFPDLRLNLAHFGHQNSEWQKLILELMHNHSNLYTDLSCWTDKAELQQFRTSVFLNADDSVQKRFLYGSDYYLDLLFIDSLETYLQNFRTVFTSEEFIQIASENPMRFLGKLNSIKSINK